MHRQISAVVFDFDHTLGVDNHLEERVLRLLADRHCPSKPADAEIAAALARFRSGSMSLSSMLSDSFAGWGYSGDVTDEYRSTCLLLLPESLTITPGAADTLRALESQRLKVAILTNGWTQLQFAKASLLGFSGPVYASEAIDAWKPEARAFEVAANRLGVEIGRALYVGDSPFMDIEGAKRAGMLAAWANLESGDYPPGATKPDFEITNLAELTDVALA